MSGIRETFTDNAEARQDIARRLRSARQRYDVTTLTPGEEWEILEPEDSQMVPDACGTLTLRRQTFECRECGSKHDTKEEAYACCTEAYDDPEELDDVDDPELDEEA
jgi:hypothetical protein